MNKKGFTLVELIVSIVLVSVVMVSMLMALVKLRENYSTVSENANALVYSNAASRIINNDILQNDGIKNVSCSANHLNCDVVLGNGNKRQLQIVELAEGFSNQSSEEKIKNCKTYCNDNSKTNENCNCNGKKAIGIIETKKTSLVYYDTTKEKKLKYIKTFELETKTQIDSNNNLGTSTISGYSFLSLDTKYNTYKSNIDGYENKLATVVVRTYNGYDAEDRTYDIKMYSNSTYSKDSQLAGTVFKLKIIDDGDIKKASPNSFYLKYDVGYYKDLYGDEIDSLDNVSSKTGYTLIRYDDSNGHEVIDKSGNFLSKIAFDNTNTSKKEGEIRPVWSANTYVVSFNPGKGTLDGNSNKDVVYDSKYGDLPTASRAGYSFDGWYTSETGGSKVTSDTPVKITNNQTLYARYTPNKIDYLVRYDQENAQDENYTTKETITLNADMDSEVTVKPKTYTGFKAPSEQKITIKESGNSVTFQYKRNVAKIKLNANGGKLNADDGYNVKFSLKDDGTVLTNGNVYYQNIKHEQVLGTSGLANPDNKSYINLKKTGYRIPDKSEWCTKADGTGTCYQDDNSAENDPTYTSATFCNTNSGDCEITLYVHWVARTYTVTFEKNDGSGDNAGTRTVTYDAKYGTLPTLSRTGYTFTGWFTAASGGTQVTSDTIVKITEAQTLYAHWTPNKYIVTFIKNDGTSNNAGTRTVTYDAKYGTLPTVSRSGYTFLGWYTAASGGTQVTSATKVTQAKDHTLYAQWKADRITCPELTYKCSNTSKGSNYKLTYNGKCEVTCENENWKVKFLTSGTLTTTVSLNVDVFLVGGGGGGYTTDYSVGGAGGGGYTKTVKNITLQPNTYKIDVGAGGGGGQNGKSSTVKLNNAIINGLSAAGGKTGTIKSGCCGYCSFGGAGGNTGGGFSDCNQGTPLFPTTFGGGQGSTTCEFGEGTTTGCNPGVKQYSGGGCCGCCFTPSAGGGACSGGSGQANTGGGGGAYYLNVGSGGSGIVIIRNKR